MDAEKVTLTEDIAEWDYGIYEGLRATEIRSLRRERGLDESMDWNIWRDGCAEMVTERLDRLIHQIRETQKPHMDGSKPVDVVLVGLDTTLLAIIDDYTQVAHGLILRAFVKRWLKCPLDTPLPMMLSPGAIGILR